MTKTIFDMSDEEYAQYLNMIMTDEYIDTFIQLYKQLEKEENA